MKKCKKRHYEDSVDAMWDIALGWHLSNIDLMSPYFCHECRCWHIGHSRTLAMAEKARQFAIQSAGLGSDWKMISKVKKGAKTR